MIRCHLKKIDKIIQSSSLLLTRATHTHTHESFESTDGGGRSLMKVLCMLVEAEFIVQSESEVFEAVNQFQAVLLLMRFGMLE